MDCPRCRTPLARVDEGLYEDIETHACGACGGVFYPPGSLDRLDDSVAVNIEEIPIRPTPGERPLRCPVGHGALGETYRGAGATSLMTGEPVDAPDIRLACCTRCAGFWLEGDALERLRELALVLSTRDNRELNWRTRQRQEEEAIRNGRRR